jgi:hypothetical protein
VTLEALRTDSRTFEALVHMRRFRKDDWYKVPAGRRRVQRAASGARSRRLNPRFTRHVLFPIIARQLVTAEDSSAYDVARLPGNGSLPLHVLQGTACSGDIGRTTSSYHWEK